MAIKGLTLSSSSFITSVYDTAPEEQKTRFEIGTLDSAIVGHIFDRAASQKFNPATGEVEAVANNNQVVFDACVFGLRGWQRFQDEAGNDIEFRTLKRSVGGRSYTVADPACVNLIPAVVIIEIGNAIMDLNKVSVEEGND